MTTDDEVLQIPRSELDAALERLHKRANYIDDSRACSDHYAAGLIEGAEHLNREIEQRADPLRSE